MIPLPRILISFCLLFMALQAQSQEVALHGKMLDQNLNGLEGVFIQGPKSSTVSIDDGTFVLRELSPGDLVVFTHLAYAPDSFRVALNASDSIFITKKLTPLNTQLETVDVQDDKGRSTGEVSLEQKDVELLPSANESVEALITTLPGVNSNNELSSQYNVRGGNFDENLVYVNDFQVYRPFLVRNGQQEGLSFINPDLVENIQFSAGGFDAQYGDKMSSVLNITYKEPKSFGLKMSASLLGGSSTLEGRIMGGRLSYIMGFRHRTTRLLLNSLDTDADYRPAFTDFQSLFTYYINEDFKIQWFSNLASNSYQYIPRTRQTEFGTVTQALRLTVFFDGQEIDEYQTAVSALSASYKPNDRTELKWILSTFNTQEYENFDIQGQYFIGELDNNLGSENFGEVLFNRGVGTYINHARNRLWAQVVSAEHKGKHIAEGHSYRWGVKYNFEQIDDVLREWVMIDSAGFSKPNSSGDQAFELNEAYRSDIQLQSHRWAAFAQRDDQWESDHGQWSSSIGLRWTYWSFNGDHNFSPRGRISFIPNWEKDWSFRLASGLYYQPPFYREIRDYDGILHPEVRAQQSIHYVFGADVNFKQWNRPFKWTGELYYKDLNQLNPYNIDNLRIRYSAQNNADGRAYGLDMKLHGEFVKGIDSWMSVSVMRIEEDIEGDSYFDNQDSVTVSPGFIPRPTDQRVSVSFYFQDYLPSDPSFTVNLGLYFSTGLPFGPPQSERYQQTLRTPPYRRVDIGFSKILKDADHEAKKWKFLNRFESVWLTVEVFNLLKINNTTSYLWVNDVNNNQFAVPNFLTSRLLNVKLKMEL